jgi:hypothetical protein
MTSGRHCIAAGNGLSGGVAGVTAVVSVVCRDARNEKKTQGGDVVTVSMAAEGGPTTDAHVIDNTDGTYTCTYLPTFASANCRVSVSVNGTHVIGSPFPAQVTPGRTEARASEVFGHGLNDGVSGQKNVFTIQTKDPFGNRCVASADEKDVFNITIKPLASLVPELETFLRRYECTHALVDNEDGTQTVEYTVEHAGFYAVDVTLGNVPVGESPYTACICNPTIAFPPTLSLTPVEGATGPSGLPEGILRACDMVRVHDLIVLLRSQPIHLTSNRREREYVHVYKLCSAMARGKEEWKCITLRGTMLPPPERRECLCIDQKLIAVCHADLGGDKGPLDTLRVLDMSDLGEKLQWSEMGIDGKFPSAIEGYAVSVWGGKQAILVSGGLNKDGGCVSDIFLLTLGGAMNAASVGTWSVLAEWPASIFSGQGFRCACGPPQKEPSVPTPSTLQRALARRVTAHGPTLNA